MSKRPEKILQPHVNLKGKSNKYLSIKDLDRYLQNDKSFYVYSYTTELIRALSRLHP